MSHFPPKMKGQAVTVNGDRYRAMLNEFLFTKIEEDNIYNIWFQQERATCHIAGATLDVFEDGIISCRVAIMLRFDTVGVLFVGCRRR